MKFEFVEFYEATEELKSKVDKKIIGTVHIYVIDCELDIRGINVFRKGEGIFFNFPHFIATDPDTKLKLRYPLIRWTNEKTHQEMIDFLHKEVKPIVYERMKKHKDPKSTMPKKRTDFSCKDPSSYKTCVGSKK